MLVLTRKKEQSIVIGENIEVMVLGVSGDKVRLGFTAPRDVEVYRKEVAEARAADTEQRTFDPRPRPEDEVADKAMARHMRKNGLIT